MQSKKLSSRKGTRSLTALALIILFSTMEVQAQEYEETEGPSTGEIVMAVGQLYFNMERQRQEQIEWQNQNVHNYRLPMHQNWKPLEMENVFQKQLELNLQNDD